MIHSRERRGAAKMAVADSGTEDFSHLFQNIVALLRELFCVE
jgi:hypothetical protein